MVSSPFILLSTPSAAASSLDEEGMSQGQELVLDVMDTWNDKKWDWGAFADEDGYVRVIVSYQDGASDARMALQTDSVRGSLFDKIEASRSKAFSKVFDGSACRISLEDLDEVLSSPELGIAVYPDLKVTAMLVDSVIQVGATELWSMRDPANRPVTGVGMVVAVIDTGVDYMHPDLGGGIGPSHKVVGGYDFVNEDTDPMDDNGQHGPIEQAIIGTKVKDESNPFEIVRIIRSFDPCLACSIHVVTPKGRDLGKFRVV